MPHPEQAGCLRSQPEYVTVLARIISPRLERIEVPNWNLKRGPWGPPLPTCRHVVQLLTGLAKTEITELGGFMVAEPFTGNRVYESRNTNLAA